MKSGWVISLIWLYDLSAVILSCRVSLIFTFNIKYREKQELIFFIFQQDSHSHTTELTKSGKTLNL